MVDMRLQQRLQQSCPTQQLAVLPGPQVEGEEPIMLHVPLPLELRMAVEMGIRRPPDPAQQQQ
jgi:hypothetical protein